MKRPFPAQVLQQLRRDRRMGDHPHLAGTTAPLAIQFDKQHGGRRTRCRQQRIGTAEVAALSVLCVLLLVGTQATAQTGQEGARPTESGFSFAVYGDSRSMMYLPYHSKQKEEAIKLMVDMF